MRDISTDNVTLMADARESLRGNWGLGAAVSFLYLSLGIVLQSISGMGTLVWFVIIGPLTLGVTALCLKVSRGQPVRFQEAFDGFNRFSTALAAYWFQALLILLWALLLIVPGIIAALGYSMTFWLLADEPGLGAVDAMKKSKAMMFGHRWKLFCLFLRFTGWFLLSLLTAGLGFLWLFPYMAVSVAKFYEDIKT